MRRALNFNKKILLNNFLKFNKSSTFISLRSNALKKVYQIIKRKVVIKVNNQPFYSNIQIEKV